VKYLDITPALSGPDGEISPRFSLEGLHLTDAGYESWAAQLTPTLRNIFSY
jgi:lysophospholipase L1-like esterase